MMSFGLSTVQVYYASFKLSVYEQEFRQRYRLCILMGIVIIQ